MSSGVVSAELMPSEDDVSAGLKATRRHRRMRTPMGLAGAGALLVAVVLASLALGSVEISIHDVVGALDGHAVDDAQQIVLHLRVPRTLIGVLAGLALGLAGALMQGLSRNPVADPGLLGINAGAALAVVTAITWFGASTPAQYVWFAFLGGLVSAAVVYGIGSLGIDGGSPLKLTIVGAAVTAMAGSFTTLVLLSHTGSLAQFRLWQVGSLTGRNMSVVSDVWPFLFVGALIALASGRALDLLALGDDLASGLGQRTEYWRIAILAAIVLLSGSATAIAGPIVFVGLVVPHLARHLVGADYRWMLSYALLLGPSLLLVADIIGRFIVRPGELEAGLTVSMVGVPVMIVMVRRMRVGSL